MKPDKGPGGRLGRCSTLLPAVVVLVASAVPSQVEAAELRITVPAPEVAPDGKLCRYELLKQEDHRDWDGHAPLPIAFACTLDKADGPTTFWWTFDDNGERRDGSNVDHATASPILVATAHAKCGDVEYSKALSMYIIGGPIGVAMAKLDDNGEIVLDDQGDPIMVPDPNPATAYAYHSPVPVAEREATSMEFLPYACWRPAQPNDGDDAASLNWRTSDGLCGIAANPTTYQVYGEVPGLDQHVYLDYSFRNHKVTWESSPVVVFDIQTRFVSMTPSDVGGVYRQGFTHRLVASPPANYAGPDQPMARVPMFERLGMSQRQWKDDQNQETNWFDDGFGNLETMWETGDGGEFTDTFTPGNFPDRRPQAMAHGAGSVKVCLVRQAYHAGCVDPAVGGKVAEFDVQWYTDHVDQTKK